MYKILTSVLLLTSLFFASLWYEASRTTEIDTFTTKAATSAVAELPFRLEDVTLSFESFHIESEAENKYTPRLLTRSLQQLTGNQRLLHAAERSSELEKGWFRDYTNELFTLRSILTETSFENEGPVPPEEMAAELKKLKANVRSIVDHESFSVADQQKMRALTKALSNFNKKYLS